MVRSPLQIAVPSNSALFKAIGGNFRYFMITRDLQAVEFDQG